MVRQMSVYSTVKKTLYLWSFTLLYTLDSILPIVCGVLKLAAVTFEEKARKTGKIAKESLLLILKSFDNNNNVSGFNK
jgi:hypothetical protein